MRHLEQLQRALDDTLQEVRNLIVMGMAPGLSPDKAAFIQNLERSARAEVRLRVKALEYAKGRQG